MKRKVREDRLNLRQPSVRPEGCVVVDGCINLVFFTEVIIVICCGMLLSYVTVSPFVMLPSVPVLYYGLFLFYVTIMSSFYFSLVVRCCNV